MSVSNPTETKSQKSETLIGAQVHDKRNRLIYVGRNNRMRSEKKVQKKVCHESSLPIERQLEDCLAI